MEGTRRETETVEKEIWGSHEIRMIIVHDIDKVGFTPSVITHIETVDIQLNFICGRCECTVDRGIRRRKIFHWMIECEILDDFTRCDVLLYLSDEKIMFTGGDVSTLLVVEIVIVRIAFNIVVCSCTRPVNSNLYVVIVEGDKWKRTLGTLTKEKAERIEVGTSAHTWVCTVRTLGNILSESIDGNLLCEDGILCIDERTTDVQFHFIDDRVPSLNIESLGRVI